MGLLDSISRLSVSTDDIYTAANRTIADVGPFTDAVLGRHLITDIIRDADDGEQTLFTHRTVDAAGIKRGVDVRPVQVPLGSVSVPGGAGVARALGGLDKEVDVDALLGAALRLVESYGSMPRAKGHIEQLHDRAAEVRTRISFLEDELEELKTSSSSSVLPPEPELPSLKDEERSVVRFESDLAAARRKRDALKEQIAAKKRIRAMSNTGQTISTPTAAARTRTRPGAAAAAVNSKIANPFLSRKVLQDPDGTTNISVHLPSGINMPESLVDERPPEWADDSILSNTTQEAEDEDEGDESKIGAGVDSLWERDDDELGEDATVVLAIPPAVDYSPPPSPVRAPVAPPLRVSSLAVATAAVVPAPVPEAAPVVVPAPAPAPAPAKPVIETKAKTMQDPTASVTITSEVEANTVLIWSTVGKVIAPSSNYGSDDHPSAAETITILQSLASQSFSNAPASPSSASTLQNISEPAPAQTILTAILLLHLLREGPSPLPVVRSALAEKEGDSSMAGGLGIKALYACVAKKLLKIDRKGREATVRFE